MFMKSAFLRLNCLVVLNTFYSCIFATKIILVAVAIKYDHLNNTCFLHYEYLDLSCVW